MKIIRVKNYSTLSRIACGFLIEEINRKPNLVLGFATGGTPRGIYKELVNSYKKKFVDFFKVKSFNLDEYYPIKKSNKNSFYYYMYKNLFKHVNIKKKNINFLNGETRDVKKEVLRYEENLAKSPIGILILGVGVNGHIGFNEPGSSFSSKTRLVELSKETIEQNSKSFRGSKMPTKALTMGIKTIMSAKKILLLADGKDKAEAIRYLIKCKPFENCPVSVLNRHKNVIVIADEKAMGFS